MCFVIIYKPSKQRATNYQHLTLYYCRAGVPQVIVRYVCHSCHSTRLTQETRQLQRCQRGADCAVTGQRLLGQRIDGRLGYGRVSVYYICVRDVCVWATPPHHVDRNSLANVADVAWHRNCVVFGDVCSDVLGTLRGWIWTKQRKKNGLRLQSEKCTKFCLNLLKFEGNLKL